MPQCGTTSSMAAPRPSTIVVDLGLGDHERRRDLEGVAAQDARRDAVPQRGHDGPLGQAGVGGQQLRRERDRRRQPDGPDLPDARRALQPPDLPIQHRLQRRDARDQALAPRGCRGWPSPRPRHRRGPSTCSRGGTPRPGTSSSQNGARTRSPDEHAAERHVARRDALGERDQVRLDAVALRRPTGARSARTR